jgi:hypothetical protein
LLPYQNTSALSINRSLGGMTVSISNSNVFVVANATTDGNSNDGNGNGESNASDDGNASIIDDDPAVS